MLSEILASAFVVILLAVSFFLAVIVALFSVHLFLQMYEELVDA